MAKGKLNVEKFTDEGLSQAREKYTLDTDRGLLLDKETGLLAGRRVSPLSERRLIRLCGRTEVAAGTVAWALHFGEWPTNRLKYFNGDASDLRPSNMYISTRNPSRHGEYSFMGPGARKNRALLATFGLTLDEYDAMSEAQGHTCAICGAAETAMGVGGDIRKLAVDHSHDDGSIRGLLCDACNKAIGQLKDSVEIIRRAADYLEEWHTLPNEKKRYAKPTKIGRIKKTQRQLPAEVVNPRRQSWKDSKSMKGITYHKGSNKWTAYFMLDGKPQGLGYYVDREDAEAARLLWEEHRDDPTTLKEELRLLKFCSQKAPPRANKYGTGVTMTRDGKFTATIKLDGKRRHLGTFVDPKLAEAAYQEAKLAWEEAQL